MHYTVKLTTQAIEQINETVQYLSKVLAEPKAALKWADTLQYEIAKLDYMPSRHLLAEEELWHTKGIRRLLVKNFLVYYLIDEEKKIVWVTAIIYEKRDQIAVLSDMSLNDI